MPSRPAQSTRRIVVALDGPASSGKSSVGAAAAEQLQLRFVDTGLFYRALTALALLDGVELDDPGALVPLVDRISLGDDGSGRFTRVLLDGADATDEARSALVDGSVSTVARVPEVRAALLDRQRELAAEGGIVMAGRDVGTVVLPDADLKLFLDASVEERARRRIEERGLDPEGAEAEEVREQLRARDAIDTGREVAPLRAADDAVHVLTDGNAFDETVEIIAAEIAGVMLTPRPRTRKAPVAAPIVAEELVVDAGLAAASEPDSAPKPKRTRAPKAAAAAAASESKPKRTRAPRAAATAVAAAGSKPKPTRARKPKAAPEPAPEPQADSQATPAPEPEPAAPETEPAPEPEAGTHAKPAPTRRSQSRARATARRAALAVAATEPVASTSRDEESADLGQDSSHQDEFSPDKGVEGGETGQDSNPESDDGAPEPDSSYSGVGDSAEPAPKPKPAHTPTRRSQERARATARRAALAAAATSDEEPEADEAASASAGEHQPTTKLEHTPTKRSQARARSTARRAALATAATPDQEAIAASEPEPDRDPDAAAGSDAPEAAALKAAHTPTKRSQARTRSTARRAAAAAAAATSEPDAAPETEPAPEPHLEPEPEPNPELAVAPLAAASAAAVTQRTPRPAAKPRERDPILEAAMRLDNDQSMVVRMTALVARIGARLVADVDIQGIDHIPRHGAVILAVNHISNADPVVVGGWITEALKRRRIHWMGKRELFSWPVVGWLAAHGGIHPVDRDAADLEAYRLAMKILENGYVLLVFPEGTRSATGELQEAKDGVAMLALRTGAPIVPIGVNNTDAVWRKGSALPLPFPRRRVTVRIGTPFRVQDVIPADAGKREAKGLATTAIMGRIAALLDPRHRGVYADAVPGRRPSEG